MIYHDGPIVPGFRALDQIHVPWSRVRIPRVLRGGEAPGITNDDLRQLGGEGFIIAD